MLLQHNVGLVQLSRRKELIPEMIVWKIACCLEERYVREQCGYEKFTVPVEQEWQNLACCREGSVGREEYINIGALEFSIVACKWLNKPLQSSRLDKADSNSLPLQMGNFIIRILKIQTIDSSIKNQKPFLRFFSSALKKYPWLPTPKNFLNIFLRKVF